MNVKAQSMPVDIILLAKGQTNGFDRVGNASKLGKSRRITKTGTIGLPILFTRCVYNVKIPLDFPFKVIQTVEKKMQSKKKRIC
jgi:hypothetical protein